MVMEYRLLGRTGEKIAAIGLGTWLIGGGSSPDYSMDMEAIEAIRYAIELGMTHIDTAEMYGGGHAEELVGEAIKSFKRDEIFIASKVWHTNLRYDDVLRACERSLRRIQTSYIDLYYIHWPSDVIPLSETMKAMERLYKDGKIRYIGLSNFSPTQIEEARSYLSTTDVVAIQAEYSLYNRKIEGDVIPYCFRNNLTVVAYSPLARGALLVDLRKPMERRVKLLMELAEKYSKTPVQIALNWVIWHDQVIAIPKALQRQHLEENAGAAGWKLTKEDYDLISKTW
ncbi:MAG: aldo/keto reductase [Thaumarchaeota archaeon]|jgi:diketogulonate reductase-like aldo/keto reductase|nr:aldo/keto reductase [Candidatus Wolframiiraptor allenii]